MDPQRLASPFPHTATPAVLIVKVRVPRVAVTLAREWLILVVMIALGFGWPAVLATAMGVEFSGDLYEMLFDPSDDAWWIAWLVVLAPYSLVQFVRSLVWAVRISSR